jgi:hypothetical protein
MTPTSRTTSRTTTKTDAAPAARSSDFESVGDILARMFGGDFGPRQSERAVRGRQRAERKLPPRVANPDEREI